MSVFLTPHYKINKLSSINSHFFTLVKVEKVSFSLAQQNLFVCALNNVLQNFILTKSLSYPVSFIISWIVIKTQTWCGILLCNSTSLNMLASPEMVLFSYFLSYPRVFWKYIRHKYIHILKIMSGFVYTSSSPSFTPNLSRLEFVPSLHWNCSS